MKLLHSAALLVALGQFAIAQRITITRTTADGRPTTTQQPPRPPPTTSNRPPPPPTTTNRPPPPPTTTTNRPPPPTGSPGQPAGPPPGFNITDVGVNGSGCPPGSASYTLAQDRSSVTIVLSQMGAEAGPNISASANRKNCQITLGVRIPGGFSMALTTVDYRGYYQLDRGVTASQDALYYWQGEIVQANAHGNLQGPIDGKQYTYRDSFNITSTNYSACGKSTVLNIANAVSVSNSGNRTGSGFITLDSVDAALRTTYNFQWATC